MRYKITFSYSGEHFNGFQKQPKKRTVQEEIEKVLSSINDSKVKITGAGRTDSKVNARCQVAHFDLDKNITPYKLKWALNGNLPPDIYINAVDEVPDDFHARYMVKSKTYSYYINNGIYNPIIDNHVYFHKKKLNISNMRKALKYLIGTHDFTSFASAEDKRDDKVRKIYDIKIEKDKDIIIITFVGSGFLKYQVRNMVGVLLKVGEEKIEPSYVKTIIDKKDRRASSITAPPNGLTLENIEY